MGFGMQM
jgi:DnaJ-related protein SCJ1